MQKTAKTKKKTHKGALKRFKLTKTGKVTRRGHGARHLASSKTKRQLRRLKTTSQVKGRQRIKLQRMLQA